MRSMNLSKVFMLVIIMNMWGCASAPHVPEYIHSNFTQLNIQTIAILPIVDARSDATVEVKFEENIRVHAHTALKERGYKVLMPKNNLIGGKPVEGDEVAEMNNEELVALVPAEADAIILIYLTDLRVGWEAMGILPYWRFQIDLKGRMITKDKGVTWSDQTTLARGDGGLLGGGMAAAGLEGYYEDAVNILLAGVPGR